jgi:hypothetical protein
MQCMNMYIMVHDVNFLKNKLEKKKIQGMQFCHYVLWKKKNPWLHYLGKNWKKLYDDMALYYMLY